MEEHLTVNIGSSSLSDAIDFIAHNFSPEDIFSERDLDEWAERNKYVKE